MPRHPRALAVVVALLLAALATPSAARPHDNGHRKDGKHGEHTSAVRTVRFSSPFKDPGSRVTGIGPCSPTRPGVCALRLEGDAFFTGALTAHDIYHGYEWLDPQQQNFDGETWDRQIGTLAGCGEGSFVMHQTEIHMDRPHSNLAGGTFRVILRWTVEPGSGTGDFAGARGSGTGYGDFTPTLANSGVYTGTITCGG